MNETTMFKVLEIIAEEVKNGETQETEETYKSIITDVSKDIHNNILLMKDNLRTMEQTLEKISKLDDLESLSGYLLGAENWLQKINKSFQKFIMVGILEKYKN